jgi:aspartokinase-like uncharacterized kinase
MSDLVVVKVGGSLYDLPDLRQRLGQWLETDGRVRPPVSVVVIPGGGALVDAIRDLDRRHTLGQERSHWLALRALGVNARFLAHLVDAALVDEPRVVGARVRVLDPFAFLRADERRHGMATLPHSWDATADSVAARVAVATQAQRLILLKSVTMPLGDVTSGDAAQRGLVDPVFASILRTGPGHLEVSTVNLREWRP